VDGAVATIGQKVDSKCAVVAIDGVRLPVRPDAVYYLVYKPVGVISTTADELGRPTVTGIVPPEPPVYPVGRLDADSEGLLVVTNDGDLTHHLTHPRHEVTKTYTVFTTGRLSAADARRLETGVELDDGPAAARSARIIDVGPRGTLLEVVMAEGRNREVRRMIGALGEEVISLVRTAIADLADRNLAPGTWRHLTPAEVRRLFAAGVDRALSDSWENGSSNDPDPDSHG
jgi:23S rRNA pseudouridine2605 synthase